MPDKDGMVKKRLKLFKEHTDPGGWFYVQRTVEREESNRMVLVNRVSSEEGSSSSYMFFSPEEALVLAKWILSSFK